MGRASTVEKLPIDVKIEIKRRIRTRNHTIEGLAEWLNQLGYNVSKSAVGRYSIKVNEQDSCRAVDQEVMANCNDVDIVGLFDELSQLRARETEILAILSSKIIRNTGKSK